MTPSRRIGESEMGALFAIDAGHKNNARDRGGSSLGIPESDLVLPYAKEIATELERLGHRAILTRPDDSPVLLSARAKIANDAGADCFVSIHANASDNPDAAGPWTIHAKGSAEGERIARLVQAALAPLAPKGRAEAVYPDASSWVGNRRLAVLRQTRMPAVLVELGFMTNPEESERMESPEWRTRASLAIAHALSRAIAPGVPISSPDGHPLRRQTDLFPEPELARTASLLPPPLMHPEMVLQPIRVPLPEHLEQVTRAAGIRPEWMKHTIPPLLAILHAMAKGNEGPRAAIIAELIGAAEAYAEKHCRP